MTIQQLNYLITTVEKGSITEAAKALYLSQPSLSSAIKEVEKAAGITIFNRCHTGVAPTKEGLEFLGCARQVLQQMDLLEAKYTGKQTPKQRFCVSTQHYTFTTNAFVELVRRFGQERYEFILNETQTHQILEDVRNRYCDLGILFLSQSNEAVLRRSFDAYDLAFYELFPASPHIFVRRGHPLSQQNQVTLQDLTPYPRLNSVQGIYESASFSEELFSSQPSEKVIRVSDRAAIVNLMLGLDGYTISSGIFPSFLQGDQILSIPIAASEFMHIGYVLNRGQALSKLGQLYIEQLTQYRPQLNP